LGALRDRKKKGLLLKKPVDERIVKKKRKNICRGRRRKTGRKGGTIVACFRVKRVAGSQGKRGKRELGPQLEVFWIS